jgi:hypothetical protein
MSLLSGHSGTRAACQVYSSRPPIPPKQLPISDLRHPLSAGEMTIERAPRPIGLPLGVNVQDDPRDLVPIGAVCIGIKHAEIRDGAIGQRSTRR